MVNLPDDQSFKFEMLYPNHKQFGVLALVLVLAQLVARAVYRVPGPAPGLQVWERRLSGLVHKALLVLMILVPVMGYSMSSSFTQSAGVPFFFIDRLPDLLPKNDRAFEVYQLLHKVLAYVLLALLSLHVVGVVKHRFFDRDPSSDVWHRMV